MLCIICITFRPQTLTAAEKTVFSRDILPLLSENCFFCHGPDAGQRQADLRLDTEEGIRRVVDAGTPSESLLLERVLSSDPDLMMPPADSNRRLSPAQKETLKQWVSEGAHWGRHWAFETLVAPEVPVVKNDFPQHNAIDSFVQEEQIQHGLAPSQSANRNTLLRRVSLDLTGLPPTPDQLSSFLNDKSPDAYENAVDRLLSSRAFGERMAWEWLDAARYADSNGYQGDRERTMWPWRDWVVSAFNRNIPFDQFSTYQLAGDLLPDPTDEQKLATGFCRNHMINGEGGRIPEENRVDYVMDMTETMGTVWLGLTLNCCRCHDHKYDPLTQNEYYQFFDYFNQTPVTGGGGDPQAAPNLSVLSPAGRQQVEDLESQRRKAAAELSNVAASLPDRQPEWEKGILANGSTTSWELLTPKSFVAENQELSVLEDGSVLAGGTNAVNDTYTLRFDLSVGKLASIRLDALRHATMTKGGIARSDSGNFVLTDMKCTLLRGDERLPVLIESAEATFEQGPLKVANVFDNDRSSGWAVYAGKPIDTDHAAVFRFRPTHDVRQGDELEIVLRHDSPHKFHNLGRFRMSVSEQSAAPLKIEVGAWLADLKTPAEERTNEQRQRISDEFLKRDSEYTKLLAKRDAAAKRIADVRKAAPKVMVMQDKSERRTTFVLNRGLYNDPTDREVTANTPVSLPRRTAASGKQSRLDLARWLFSNDQPLTARVTVNRFWQQFFGTGLVKTIEDFGVQAEYPPHKDLLDWLAVDFRDNGWDVKRLIKTIVMSHTYRQSSAIRMVQPSGSDENVSTAEIDPENRLLARASRFRLPAWMLRDQALSAAGLLNTTVGGAPVNTYQPPGVWEEATFGKKKYKRDDGDKLYRRSLYIFWRRIIAPTMFFDNASRQTCTVKSLRTNTPLHALLTLNETTYVEAARHLAQTLLTSRTARGDAEIIRQAYLRILSREPTTDETAIMLSGLERSRTEFAAAPSAAAQLLTVGASKRDDSIPVEEHAALTSACLILLNLDETLNRE